MHKVRSLNASVDQTLGPVYQVVVSKFLHSELLRITHDEDTGHLRVRKTYSKIFSHFFFFLISSKASAFPVSSVTFVKLWINQAQAPNLFHFILSLSLKYHSERQ